MSGIKDVEYAMNGEPNKRGRKPKEYVPEPKFTKTTKPDNTGFVVFKLANPNKDGGIRMQGIDFVIDPRTVTDEKPQGDGPEMIRLLAGVTTIWAKEQKNLTKEYVDRNLRFVEFPRGTRFISVPNWDMALLEFMRHTRHNTQAPNRTTGTKTEFFEYDPTAASKAAFEEEMLEIEMVLKAKDQPVEKMKRHAFYLGIKLNDEFTHAPKKEDALRTEYIIYAKRDPKTFRQSFDSKEVDVQFLIRNAIMEGKIDIGKGDGNAYWGKNGGAISKLPKNENPIQYLTDLALTNSDEGKMFKEGLGSLGT
jgi:hypothetical protein